MLDDKEGRNPGADIPNPKPVDPYTVLAAGYDVVMEHVEYDIWAEYVYGLLMEHHPEARRVLELGCGTGSLAFELQPMGGFLYAGTDRSAAMIEVARRKAEMYDAPVQFEVADFTSFRVDRPVDTVILLYDGLNYLLEHEAIAAMLRCAFEALAPGGVFVFDQSTPSNSLNNEPYFEDRGRVDEFDYVRRSRYDRETHLHTTTLDIRVGERRFRETHVQRAYHFDEVRALVDAAGFEVLATYDSFSTAPATAESERIHWVVRRP